MNPALPPGQLPSIRHRVLSLDGGGAKGVYTLGFLSRLEKDLGKPLSEHFDVIFGTSTGSIISTLLSLWASVDDVYALYLENIPGVLSPWTAEGRSSKLRTTVERLLKGKTFADLRKPTGIVATNWTTTMPLIFKNYATMAHSGASAFLPGFGASLADAVCASCSAGRNSRLPPIEEWQVKQNWCTEPVHRRAISFGPR